MLIYVRHGATALNKGGTEERLRGWSDVPLTPEGQQQSDRAGQRLRGLEPETFSSSDLPRAMESAHIVGAHLGRTPDADPALRDWNTGDLAGQRFVDVQKQLFGLLDSPDVAAPNGESVNEYLTRFVPAMRQRVEDDRMHVVVGHARGAMVLQGLASPGNGVGADLDKHFLKERPNLEPGDIMTVQPTWKTKILSTGSDGEESA